MSGQRVIGGPDAPHGLADSTPDALLDTPAGEAMIEAGAKTLNLRSGDAEIAANNVLVAALSVTVECAACGGIGKVRQLRGPTLAVEIHPCLSCEGTGRRLAIKEMLDE